MRRGVAVDSRERDVADLDNRLGRRGSDEQHPVDGLVGVGVGRVREPEVAAERMGEHRGDGRVEARELGSQLA